VSGRVGHPSFLELDRATLGRGTPETAQHIEGCVRCQSHASALRATAQLPRWVRELEASPLPRWSPRPWMLVGGGLAFAALVAVGLRPWLATPASSPVRVVVAAKGSPTVALYIMREGLIFLWDGRAPIQAGDHLQLEVAAGGFSRVTVASTGADAELLYSGPIDPDRPAMLPRSFAVDSRPGTERLALGLSRQELTTEALVAAAAEHRRDSMLWTTELVLTKAQVPRP